MKQEVKSVLKKTVKIAGVTCLAAGSIAVLTSGMALKAISEGGKYLASTVKRIINEKEGIIEGAVANEDDFVTGDATPVQEGVSIDAAEAI